MKTSVITITKCLTVLFALSSVFSCKKEHLLPDPPPGNAAPLVYISAILDSDSLYLAGGVNNYVGSTSVADTLTHRTFVFTLQNPNHPTQSYFQLSINNYDSVLANLQNDLDSTIHTGTLHYQDSTHFIPNAVKVIVCDSAGVKYSSEWLNQTHIFSIIAVTDIVFDNKHYKQATLQFECNLSDHNGHVMALVHGNAIVLFSVD